jgi:predicted lipoprotein
MTRVIDEIVEEALRELSDAQAQARLWSSTGETDVSSLTEAKSRLWDDSGLGAAMKRGVVYSDSIDMQLRRLHDTLRRIDENAPVALLLGSEDLVTARSLASDLLEQLRNFGDGLGER